MTNNKTTIQVSKATRDRLKRHGRMGESYDDLLNRIMDFLEKLSTSDKRYLDES